MEISVRDASDAEALEILNEPSVRRLIQFDPIGIHPEWAVLMMDEKLLVLVQVNDDALAQDGHGQFNVAPAFLQCNHIADGHFVGINRIHGISSASRHHGEAEAMP